MGPVLFACLIFIAKTETVLFILIRHHQLYVYHNTAPVRLLSRRDNLVTCDIIWLIESFFLPKFFVYLIHTFHIPLVNTLTLWIHRLATTSLPDEVISSGCNISYYHLFHLYFILSPSGACAATVLLARQEQEMRKTINVHNNYLLTHLILFILYIPYFIGKSKGFLQNKHNVLLSGAIM